MINYLPILYLSFFNLSFFIVLVFVAINFYKLIRFITIVKNSSNHKLTNFLEILFITKKNQSQQELKILNEIFLRNKYCTDEITKKVTFKIFSKIVENEKEIFIKKYKKIIILTL